MAPIPADLIQPIAPNCPIDEHYHYPGQFCAGCADLMGWTRGDKPIFQGLFTNEGKKSQCSNTHPIEVLQNFGAFKTQGVTFRWRGTVICVEKTLDHKGSEYLSITVAGAGGVELTPRGNSATWTISAAVSDPNGAGASNSADASTSDGPVSDATGFAT